MWIFVDPTYARLQSWSTQSDFTGMGGAAEAETAAKKQTKACLSTH